MAITDWPEGIEQDDTVICAICQRRISLTTATAGLCDNNTGQAFACDEHFGNSSDCIIGWTDFAIARQRSHALQPDYQEVMSHGPHLH